MMQPQDIAIHPRYICLVMKHYIIKGIGLVPNQSPIVIEQAYATKEITQLLKAEAAVMKFCLNQLFDNPPPFVDKV